jgi:hypothetical protein
VAPLCTLPRNTEPATVTIGLFSELFKLAATLPDSTEVERALATSFRVMHSVQNILTSRKDVHAIQAERNPNHLNARADEHFRTELALDSLQYIFNALESAALLSSLLMCISDAQLSPLGKVVAHPTMLSVQNLPITPWTSANGLIRNTFRICAPRRVSTPLCASLTMAGRATPSTKPFLRFSSKLILPPLQPT